MSKLLDDLARTLATPMPRRRALRTLGGALVAVAVPGVFPPQRATASARAPGRSLQPCTISCPSHSPVPCLCRGPNPMYCFETCGVAGSTCCCQKNSSGQPVGAVACPPGTRCGRPGESNCPAVCKTKLCGPSKRCCGPDQECLRFKFGPFGTKTYEACTDKCPRGSRRCPLGDGVSDIDCCPGEQNCCDGLCCGPEQVCVRALNARGEYGRLCRRRCKAPQARCNFICCDADKRAYRKRANGRIQCHCVSD